MKTRKRKRPRLEPSTLSERDLCAAFTRAAREDGWTVYPELEPWDLVLTRPGETTLQVGVQAKTRANVDVLEQAIRRYTEGEPDRRAVLVPRAPIAFAIVARELGVGVYTLGHCQSVYKRRLIHRGRYSKHGEPVPRNEIVAPYRDWGTTRRVWLPPIVPDVPAGVPSPIRLTKWRIGALRACRIMRRKGYVTREDFIRCGISKTAFWDVLLVDSGQREGRRHCYVPRARDDVARYGYPYRKLPDEETPELARKLAEADGEDHPLP